MNITDIITQRGIIYDRYLGTTLTLPYSSFESIKIQPNETVTNYNINSIISKLYDNFLYIYKSAHAASNIIPITAVATAGVYNGRFNWYRGLSSFQFSALSSIGLNPDIGSSLAVKYNAELNQYAIFTFTPNSLLAYKTDTTFTNIVTTLSTNATYYGPNIPWVQIQDIAFGDKNMLYVLDRGANSIVQYDATGFLTNDNLLQNILVYQNSIGGPGSFTDNTEFNAPVSIDFYNSVLYVLDAGNSCIKTYDYNLNWLITYRLFRDFLSAGPIQIAHDNYGSIYVLNSNWTAYKYNTNFTSKQVLDFTALSSTGVSIKRIVFSPSDSNVFYLITDTTIYKKLVDNPNDTVGYYLLDRFNFSNKERFTAFASVPTVANGIASDYNFVLSNSANAGKISLYLDNLNVTSVLTNDAFDVYSLNDVTIDSDEYLQNWVINKSISKLLINHMRLRDNITSKFLYDQTVVPGDVLLAGTRYLLPSELDSIFFEQDITNFIGANEIFQNNIINRPFEKIFNIQTKLLAVLDNDVRDYDPSRQIVYLS